VRTKIIQNEPESAVPVRPSEVASGSERNETRLRRAFFATAVVGYIVLGAVHPLELKVGDDSTLYLWSHLVQPFFVLLLAWGFWLLVKDVPGRAAQIARIAIVPYAIVYSMLDAIAGVATAMIVGQANGMNAADAEVVRRAVEIDPDYVGMVIWIASGLTWFAMALGGAIAVKRFGGLGPTLLMAVGAAIFAVGHPFPPGPIGIALFGLGIAWLEVRRAREPAAAAAPETQPVLVP
jgi:hypothetical protein